MTLFDIILFILCFGAGIFSIAAPEKAYQVLQPKKNQIAFTDEVKKSTIISGAVLLVLSIAFLVVGLVF